MPSLALPTAAPDPLQIGVRDGVVFLDVAQDAYFCRYEPHRQPPPSDRETPVDQRLELEAGDASFTPRAIYRLIRSLVRTLIDMRRCSFAQLLDRAEATLSRVPPSPFVAERYGQAVAQFERACLYVPFRFQCLFRAYWLVHFLAREKLPARWVFGATLFPFEAHCWVVRDGWLLAEHAHRLEGLDILHNVAARPA